MTDINAKKGKEISENFSELIIEKSKKTTNENTESQEQESQENREQKNHSQTKEEIKEEFSKICKKNIQI